MIYYGKESYASSNFLIHFLRGSLLFVGMILWCYSLNIAPITSVTVISFTIPIFTIILAVFFLKERIGYVRLLVAILGFIGAIIVINPFHVSFNAASLLLLIAALLFSGLDIINKKFVPQETMLSMLFYSSLTIVILSIGPALYYWSPTNLHDLLLLFILGCFANLILFCILKAFALSEASALAPFRYVELLFSGISGWILFHEIPTLHTLIGAAIIIPSTLTLVYYENRNRG
jgi:S-adenosylmethionine uptake transporter